MLRRASSRMMALAQERGVFGNMMQRSISATVTSLDGESKDDASAASKEVRVDVDDRSGCSRLLVGLVN